MTPSIPVHEKKRGRGRPATGVDPAVTIRIPERVLAAITAWAKHQGIETRSAAIVSLIESGLSVANIEASIAANRAAHAANRSAGTKTAANKKTRPRAS